MIKVLEEVMKNFLSGLKTGKGHTLIDICDQPDAHITDQYQINNCELKVFLCEN